MHRQVFGILIAFSIGACGGQERAGAPSGSGGVGGSAAAGASGGVGGGGGQAGSSGSSGSGGTSGTGGADGGVDASVPSDAGDAGSVIDAASDAGLVRAGPFAIEALPFPLELGEPIEAPERAWSFVGFPESRCANGTPTGIAINPIADAAGLLVFMQGGGACWDAMSCLVTRSSAHLVDTVNEAVVLGEAANLPGLFDHDNVANPFADYAYVYMPYCTGDIHSGTNAKSYDGPSVAETIHHHGGLNVEEYLKRLAPTFPEIERVVVSGISAGGYGATINWWRYQGAFPHARVDVLDDAGLIVDAPDDRWSLMVDSWQMVLPPGCTGCAERMSAFLPFYGVHMVAPRRYGLAGFLGDATIATVFGLSSEQVSSQMLALRAAAAPNQKTFFLAGMQHSVIAEGAFTLASDGTSLLPWIVQLANDDPAWPHAGP